jgi:hypothetical protein
MNPAPPDLVDPLYASAFAAAQAVTEQQVRAAAEIVSRLATKGERGPGLLGAITIAFATNFAALHRAEAA